MTSHPDLTERLVRVRPAGDGLPIADVAGDLDFFVTPAVRRRLVELTGRRTPVLLVDLNAVTLLSAAAIAMLLDVVGLAADRGTTVRFVANRRAVLRPLAITGDDARLPLFPSQAAAVGA